MKIVDPGVEIVDVADPLKKVEIAGRTCYKSEDLITEDSASSFVYRMIKNQHTAMLEHATFVFMLVPAQRSSEESWENTEGWQSVIGFYNQCTVNKFLNTTVASVANKMNPRYLVSGNLTAISNSFNFNPMKLAINKEYPDLFEYEKKHGCPTFQDVLALPVDLKDLLDLKGHEFKKHFYLTMKFIADRGVTHELVRHRLFSFGQESTRYCNYSKGKYGQELTFIRPSTFETWAEDQKNLFHEYLDAVENAYMYLTSRSVRPLAAQQARAILPNCLKTEIVVTGPEYEWQHFFNLRSLGTTGAPHPDMKIVADKARQLHDEYVKTQFHNMLTV